MQVLRATLWGALIGVGGWFQETTSAFTAVPDVFASDANNPNASVTSVSASATALNSDTQTATIGPGFQTTVALSSGVIYTEKVEINDPSTSPGEMRISGSGVVGMTGSFSATRVFTGNTFSDFTTYQFTLSRAASSAASLLTSAQFTLSIGAQTVFSASTLKADLTSATQAVYTFTTGNVDNVTPFQLNISGLTPSGLVGNAFVFNGASLMAVPEGGSGGLWLAGGAGMLLLRRRRFGQR